MLLYTELSNLLMRFRLQERLGWFFFSLHFSPLQGYPCLFLHLYLHSDFQSKIAGFYENLTEDRSCPIFLAWT